MGNKEIKFSLGENDINIKEISDSQLAIAQVRVVRSGMNKHKMPIDRSALEQAAKTLHNKYLVAGFSGRDFKGHERQQFIIGHFPAEFEIELIDDPEEGETFIVAKAMISKQYAPWAIDLLRDVHYGRASVSMEALATKTEIREDGYEWITEFIFTGVTVLGKRVNPSASGSELKVLSFTEEEYLKNTNDLWQNVKNREELWEKSLKLFADIQNIGENKRMEDRIKLEKDKIEDVVTVELAETEEEKNDETVIMEAPNVVVEIEVEKEDEEIEPESEEAEMYVDKTTVEEEVEMACNQKMSEIDMQAYEDMRTKLSELEVKLAELVAENDRLTKFEAEILEEKAIRFEEEKARKVEFACQEVSGDMPEEKIMEWKAKVVEFSNVDAWANALKADAYTFAKDKIVTMSVEPKPFTRMGAFTGTPKPSKKGLWDKK